MCLVIGSFFWLFLASVVGVILAILLLFPEVNSIIAPFTYGHWVPLHLNFNLYGWCSIPLLGLLCKWYVPFNKEREKIICIIISCWSLILLAGGYSWLNGGSSGKIFLDWSGIFSVAFPVFLFFLWLYFVFTFIKDEPKNKKINKLLFLICLGFVPYVFWFALNPETYPAINPDSGGATGTSLLGSTLGIVFLIYITPFIIGLKFCGNKNTSRYIFIGLLIHFALFGFLNHHDVSHHDIIQIISLGSVLIWIPLIFWHFRQFSWPIHSVSWLRSLAFWALILGVSGFLSFLPGGLEKMKFTNALVAHAHVAMAGMVTSFNMLLLVTLAPKATFIDEKLPFIFWHVGLLLMLFALAGLSSIEIENLGFLFRSISLTKIFSSLRLLSGLLMLYASFIWFKRGLKHE